MENSESIYGNVLAKKTREMFQSLLTPDDLDKIAEKVGFSTYGLKKILFYGERKLQSRHKVMYEEAIKISERKLKKLQADISKL